MEDKNNFENVQPLIPKPKNIFKYLFIITLIILLAVIIYFYFIIENNNSKTNCLPPNEDTVQQTISYQAKSIQDDVNSISKLTLIDQNNNETIIAQNEYSQMGDNTVKPGYFDFAFSSDYDFLYYVYGSGWEFSTSFLYDIKNKKNIDLGLPAETFGFTPDSKYFYACAEAGMMAGGAMVKQLPQLNNVFSQQEDQSSFNCQYNQNNNEIIFSGLKYGEKEVISQYNFSVKSGTFSKIK